MEGWVKRYMIKQIKQKKWCTFLIMIVLIIIIASVFIIIRKANENKNLEYIELKENVKDYYFVKQYGTLLLRFDNDETWEIGKDTESKFISSDIRYIAECTINGSELLIIYNNGDIYYDSERNYQGIKITNIPNAMNVSIGSRFYDKYIAIVTEEGDLYTYKANLSDIMGKEEHVERFIKVEGIPKVKKVICYREITLILTEDGDIYYSDDLNGITKETVIKKCQADFRYSDIGCGRWGAYALDESGVVYKEGRKERDGDYYMDFTQNKAYENIITMKVNYNFSAF